MEEAYIENRDYMHVFVRSSFLGETSGGHVENVQTLLEGPFADPTQGAGTDFADLGTHRRSLIIPLRAHEPRAFQPARCWAGAPSGD